MLLGTRTVCIYADHNTWFTAGDGDVAPLKAVLGNMFYGCGVLMESVEVTFIVNHMPWLLGSVGTLIFDFTIIMQYLAYGTEVEQRKKRKRLISGSDRGRGGAPIYEDDDLLQHSDKLPLLHPSSP